MPKLSIIIASTRPGRVGVPVAEWFRDRALEHDGFDVDVVDLAAVNLPLFDEPNHPRFRQYVHQHTKDWSAIVDESDAFVFVMPEYNYGFNAAIKNAIDYLHHEWTYKPVGVRQLWRRSCRYQGSANAQTGRDDPQDDPSSGVS